MSRSFTRYKPDGVLGNDVIFTALGIELSIPCQFDVASFISCVRYDFAVRSTAHKVVDILDCAIEIWWRRVCLNLMWNSRYS